MKTLPYFTIRRMSSDDDAVRFHGRFSSKEFVRGEMAAYLFVPPDRLLKGKVIEWRPRCKRGIFVTSDPDAEAMLRKAQSYLLLEGYWGERAVIVLDKSRTWKRMLFEAEDAVDYRFGSMIARVQPGNELPRRFSKGREPDEVIMVRSGWDHEHCAICWETICECCNPYGFRDERGTWICESCYEQYVLPRCLGFVPRSR